MGLDSPLFSTLQHMLDAGDNSDKSLEEFEENNEEFEDKIWRNTSIHSVIPSFTMNESINK